MKYKIKHNTNKKKIKISFQKYNTNQQEKEIK